MNPTKDAVVTAKATGSGVTFVIKSIRSIQFDARSGDGLNEPFQRLVVIFDASRANCGSTIALLGSSSGRFKSSIEAIKGEGITELAAAKSGLPVIRVTSRRLHHIYPNLLPLSCKICGGPSPRSRRSLLTPKVEAASQAAYASLPAMSNLDFGIN